MTDAGYQRHAVRAKLYLRYDCNAQVLYAYVRAVDDGVLRRDRPENAYLRIDGSGKLVSGKSGDDGKAPDFAWVGRSGSGAGGWEASGRLGPGTYRLRAHVLLKWRDADGYLPLDAVPRELKLVIRCDDDDDDKDKDKDGGAGSNGGVIFVLPLLTSTLIWSTRPQRLRRRTQGR
jgi:hypothetical protein